MIKILNWLVKLFSKDESLVVSKQRLNNLYDMIDEYNTMSLFLLEVIEEHNICNTLESRQKLKRMQEVYIERWKE